MMKHLAVVAALALVAVSCHDTPTSISESPLFEIKDAAHGDGNQHFFWLPPLVSRPASFNGPFDGTLEPVVEICQWSGSECITPLTAVFTLISGPGGRKLKVKPDRELYVARWDTDEVGDEEEHSTLYRISVKVTGTELGFVDVLLVDDLDDLDDDDDDDDDDRGAWNQITGDFVPFEEGDVLPIKFRIEIGAVIESLVQNGDFADGLSGWQFVNHCEDPGCTGPGFYEAYVQDGRAFVHGNRAGNRVDGGGAFGYLLQLFGNDVLPTRFYVDYRQEVGEGCGNIYMGLVSPGHEPRKGFVIEYFVGEHDRAPQYAIADWLFSIAPQSYAFATNDRRFETGTLEVTFNYKTMEAVVTVTTAAGATSHTFPIPSEDDVLAKGVYLGTHAACWDGRNNETGSYDGLVVEGFRW